MVFFMAYMDDNPGGDTAQFQAFQDRQDELPSAWDTRGGPRPRAWLIAGAVVAVVAVAALVLTMVSG